MAIRPLLNLAISQPHFLADHEQAYASLVIWARRSLWLAPIVLASCATYVAGRAESALLDAMPRVIGPADRYEASVEGTNAHASYFDRVHVVGVRVRRARTPVIDRFEVDLQQVGVDRSNKQVTRIGAARVVVRIKASDLTAYLSQQSWIAEPGVRLSPPDSVIISGLFKVPGLGRVASSPASFRGRLVPNGPQLLVAVDSLSMGEMAAPVLLRGLVATAINPLFDVSGYAVPSNIDSVDVQDDALIVQASGTQLRAATANIPVR